MSETILGSNQLSDNVLTKDNLRISFSNFSSSNYLRGSRILDFENASTYEFVWHIKTPSYFSGSMFMFSSIDVETTGGGFDIALNSNNLKTLWISQTSKDGTGWDFDGAISNELSTSTEYWLKMQFDGTTYSYITATDKEFTNILSTFTNASGKLIKTPNSSEKWGTSLRTNVSGSFGSGYIFISDCYLKFDNVKVFDGINMNDYGVVGTPTKTVDFIF